jgi:hypothetical protein
VGPGEPVHVGHAHGHGHAIDYVVSITALPSLLFTCGISFANKRRPLARSV